MKSIIQWLRSPQSQPPDPQVEREHTSPERSSLFQCPGCDTVYVAVEKSTCSACREPVDEVSADGD